ncbi:hypothetical protein SBI_08596 [Streptomyces bingchenggensis BCW-1]|uniref:Uncharacterized protein n=1 Tax=Streptomyces bingchenggensis (strain BCW-1) TaxID=749414 RepID=D7BUG5_STRBB|nr:hypothetical protein SBI_08596 [Streptomyces bingchenggensis BCW-1]
MTILISATSSSPGRKGCRSRRIRAWSAMIAASLASVLPSPPVALGGTADGSARDVERVLAVIEKQIDQQGGAAVGQVDAPDDLVTQGEDINRELQQFRLVVCHSPRQQPLPGVVDHHTLMMGPAGVDAGPDRCHALSTGRLLTCSTDDLAGESLLSVPNQQQSRRGVSGGESYEAIRTADH